jgi:two-component system sensor histidine kinase RegB
VVISMSFIALYAWRLAKESRQMSAALAATEMVLAREQKLHALDGLAAAAAHELGTPLSTISLVTSEMARQIPKDNPMLLEDLELLKAQAVRCREILQKLTRQPAEQDPLHSSLAVRELLAEASAPYQGARVPIVTTARAAPGAEGSSAREPTGVRQPGVIYGLGNFIENAIDFADTRVDLTAEWDAATVVLAISDNGAGFKPEIIDNLGEPYVTSRPVQSRKKYGKASGLGLGFFIAKTLLERSGAKVELENRAPPDHGAVVRVTWPRDVFEARVASAAAIAQQEVKEDLQIIAADQR